MIERPEWNHWRQMPHAELWECVALSCEIEPRKTDVNNLGPYGIDAREATSLHRRSIHKEEVERYQSRIDIASAHLSLNGQLRPLNGLKGDERKCRVSLPEFACWAISKMKWERLPSQLVAMTQEPSTQEVAPQGEVNANSNDPKAAPAESTVQISAEAKSDSLDERHSAESNSSSADATLAALFDPVSVAALEKMFPPGNSSTWANWAERASRNGLIVARKKRGVFNPYEAALWFLNQGVKDWDLARCKRALAKNLPARSIDSKHLLTGELPE